MTTPTFDAAKAPPIWVNHTRKEVIMIVAIVTFQMSKATTAGEMSAQFQAAVPMFQSVAGLLTKYFYVSEDGRRAGGIYVWASRADADRLYHGEWRAFVEKKFGSPPAIDFLSSPVMIDNRGRKSA